MKAVITTCLCLLFLVLVGCSDDRSPTETIAPPDLGFDKDRPDMTGATVIRFEEGLAVTYIDLKRSLRVVLGVDMDVYCGGVFEPDIVSIMDVINPNDQNLVNELLRGENIQCWVYPLSLFDCEIFVSEGPIATGYANVVQTDNDFWAFLEERTAQRMNSYGLTANGDLYTPEGQKVMFNLTYRAVWTGFPDMEFVNEVSKITLASW